MTQDVDLFTDEEHGVEAAAGAVQAALTAAGFAAEREDKTSGLADVFEGMGEGLAEWTVTAPGGQQMMLQMAYFDRARRPVIMEFGPVLDLEDAIGGKVSALVLLTELPMPGLRILGQRADSVTTVLDRDLREQRTRPGRSGHSSCWGAPRDRRSVESMPAA